jgi:hypothetical protein
LLVDAGICSPAAEWLRLEMTGRVSGVSRHGVFRHAQPDGQIGRAARQVSREAPDDASLLSADNEAAQDFRRRFFTSGSFRFRFSGRRRELGFANQPRNDAARFPAWPSNDSHV